MYIHSKYYKNAENSTNTQYHDDHTNYQIRLVKHGAYFFSNRHSFETKDYHNYIYVAH